MNKVYEIEYEMFGNTHFNYIVAKDIENVYKWVEENAKWEVTKIEKLGNCLAILKGESNE